MIQNWFRGHPSVRKCQRRPTLWDVVTTWCCDLCGDEELLDARSSISMVVGGGWWSAARHLHQRTTSYKKMIMDEGRGSNEAREPAEGVMNSQAGSESLDQQMQRLQIGSGMCRHGLILPFHAASECEEFVATFNAAFSVAQGSISDCFQAAIFATRKSHAGMWKDSEKMEWIVSVFAANATQCLLSGNVIDVAAAGVHTSFACFFEQWTAFKLHNNQYAIDWNLIRDLFYADEHTLRCFVRERCTSCLCLGVDLGWKQYCHE